MKLNLKEKKQALHQEYLFVLQRIDNYSNRQLTLKSILLTIVSGSIALMLSSSWGDVYSFFIGTFSVSASLLSIAIVGLLLPAVLMIALFHEGYERAKIVNTSHATDIEEEIAKHNDPAGGLAPYSIQMRGWFVTDYINRSLRARLLAKINIHGYSFFWIITLMILAAFVIDCLLLMG